MRYKSKHSVKVITILAALIILVLLSASALDTLKNERIVPAAVKNMKNPTDPEWIVPTGAKNMRNPTDPTDTEGLQIGKVLYSNHCRSCHGKTGKGDGISAEQLDTPCGDFTTAAFKAQTDGEIFYKIVEGRNEMPSYRKKIQEDEDIWFLINYLKSL